MRLKYPHIAIGALAALAPVLQFEDLVPAETYYDIVSNDFKCETMSCFNTIKDSWDAITYEGQKNDGLQLLSKMFRLCRWFIDSDSIKDEFREPEKAEDLSDWLESAYNFLAMTDYPYPTDFVMPLPGNPINEVCIKIDSCSDRTSILERIFEGISVYYNYTGAVDCFDLDDDPHGTDGWIWQGNIMLVASLSALIDVSERVNVFGPCLVRTGYQEPLLDAYITAHDDFKSALKLFGSKIIFSNGLLDPCSGGSVLEDVSETIVALTENGAHHLDLRAATAEDPDWLLQQRATEIKLIEGWLNNYYQAKKGNFWRIKVMIFGYFLVYMPLSL
ncbi:unnamed protein product [Ilex paraguariensis]|uniref:Uncharacterized protein n=1 Tax=Ilex paraguariensis TaxID=185542 RepID=A0ABC8SS31_9AQUA